MQGILKRAALALFVLAHAGCQSGRPAGAGPATLSGTAEDLWGESIDLRRSARGLVLVHPFSPSNCGYCLFDGAFVRANYLQRTVEGGGRVFHQSLFNPQRDNYTYLKHERDTATPVLTFPPALHRYHRDGYPFLAAFRDGRAVFTGSLSPYEETSVRVAQLLWPGGDSTCTPTSPLHMAARFVFENQHELAVIVIPDGDAARLAAWQENSRAWRGHPATVKYEGALAPGDLLKNLYYAGPLAAFRFAAFAGQDLPFGLHEGELRFGSHQFAVHDVELSTCFPNPRARQRYVVLEGRVWHNDVDFTLSRRGGAAGEAALLLEGFYAKPAHGRWTYCDSLAFGPVVSRAACSQGGCKAPVAGRWQEVPPAAAAASPPRWEASASGVLGRFGRAGGRFPSLAVDDQNRCWVAWEEQGNICVARAASDSGAAPRVVEGGRSDSFDPQLVACAGQLHVFFLDDRDGYYRVYGRSIDGNDRGRAFAVSPAGPYDAVTPAAATDGRNRITVAWSEWRANFRWLRYRSVAAGAREIELPDDSVRTVAVCNSGIGYTNAWYPSLACDARGRTWGAWNQHYPATLGVCAGDLEHAAASVTRLGTRAVPEEAENGGYPALAIDGAGARWVFWESFGWEVLDGTPQRICAAVFDSATAAWQGGENLANGAPSFFNQTPRAAVDPRGGLWVVWSGRDREGAGPWRIYLTRREQGRWAPPVRISPPGTSARAPVLAIGRDGQVWVAWHAGVGATMRIVVLLYQPQRGGSA